MPIRELLKTHSFGPDDIQILVTAFEEALRELRLVDRTDPVAQLAAKRINRTCAARRARPDSAARGCR